MPSFMLEDQSEFSEGETLFFLVSGIVWIPFSIVLLYGFIESFYQKLYPQYIIIGFLFIASVCRCFWFFLRPYEDVDPIGVRILSRISMLAMFNAISLLVLLWSRSLRATAFYRDSTRQSTDKRSSSGSVDSESGRSVAGSHHESLSSVRGMLQQQKESALLQAEAQQYLMHRRIIWLIVTVMLWGLCIFNSLIWDSRMVYGTFGC
jgi:hypothetical protein